MKFVRCLSAAILIALLGMLTTPARSQASTITVDFSEGFVGNFDTLLATSTDPVFAIPGFSNFRDFSYNPVAGWSGAFTSAYAIGASGPARADLVFGMTFEEGYAVLPFSVEFYAYDQTTLREWLTMSYNGAGDLANYGNWTFNTHTVPEPGTLLLLCSGLVGLALRKKIGL